MNVRLQSTKPSLNCLLTLIFRQKHFGLLKVIEGRKLIYLDTNHWIKLRHVLLASRHLQKEYAEALPLLIDLAKKGRVLCPISFPLFLELMKQTECAGRERLRRS